MEENKMLNETNSKFAVVRTSFHNGGAICFTNSLDVAKKAARKFTGDSCACGCCAVVPVTVEAKQEYLDSFDKSSNEYMYYAYNEPMKLYAELPEWAPGKYHYGAICR